MNTHLCFWNPIVVFGDHLDLDEVIRRHGEEYEEETGKKITGLSWQYARREFTGEDEKGREQMYFLYRKKVRGAVVKVTVIEP